MNEDMAMGGYPNQGVYDNRPQMMPQESVSEGSMIYQLDSEELLTLVEHMLKGQFYDEVNKEWVTDINKRFMNEVGVSKVMTELRMRINRNFFLSNLTPEMIERVCSKLHCILTKKVALNWREWDVNKQDMESIVYGVMDMVESGLYRAKDKTTLNYFRPQMHITEAGRPDQQKKKLFGVFG